MQNFLSDTDSKVRNVRVPGQIKFLQMSATYLEIPEFIASEGDIFGFKTPTSLSLRGL